MATHHFLPPDVANVASTAQLQQHYEHAKQVPELRSVHTHAYPRSHTRTQMQT